MTPEVAGLIFRKHFSTSGDRPAGSGLGLFIVAALVQAHGGTIDVQSAAGTGSAFTVRIPEAVVDAPGLPPESASQSSANL